MDFVSIFVKKIHRAECGGYVKSGIGPVARNCGIAIVLSVIDSSVIVISTYRTSRKIQIFNFPRRRRKGFPNDFPSVWILAAQFPETLFLHRTVLWLYLYTDPKSSPGDNVFHRISRGTSGSIFKKTNSGPIAVTTATSNSSSNAPSLYRSAHFYQRRRLRRK